MLAVFVWLLARLEHNSKLPFVKKIGSFDNLQ